MTVRNQPQLITYPDSLGGTIRAIDDLLRGPLDGLFGGIHLLPPFPSSGDRGFAPLTYREIDPRFGSWGDVRRLGDRLDVELDLMINHQSRQSPEFRDFARRGRRSEYADLFITLDKVWPSGDPPPGDVAKIFLRRSNPFSPVAIEETGEVVRVWTTFGREEPSEQIDIDVRSAVGHRLIEDHFRFFAEQKVRIVRLDAIGYVVKKAGTSCFMVEPEIYEVIDWLRGVAAPLGLELLTEVHAHLDVQRRLAERGVWVYDFALPGLVLDAILSRDASKLGEHLRRSPPRQFTMLDCHDGIPVQPDLDGILEPAAAIRLVDAIVAAGGNVSRILSPDHLRHPGLDAHQLNCTYWAATGRDDDAYVAARAIQLFAPGIPQLYYVGLLAGDNDPEGVAATGEGRAVNRHDFTTAEITAALAKPVVGRVLSLVRLRHDHPAFAGAVETGADGAVIEQRWRADGETATLRVDLAARTIDVEVSRPDGGTDRFRA